MAHSTMDKAFGPKGRTININPSSRDPIPLKTGKNRYLNILGRSVFGGGPCGPYSVVRGLVVPVSNGSPLLLNPIKTRSKPDDARSMNGIDRVWIAFGFGLAEEQRETDITQPICSSGRASRFWLQLILTCHFSFQATALERQAN